MAGVVGLELDLSMSSHCLASFSLTAPLPPHLSASGAAVALGPRGAAAGELCHARGLAVCPAGDRATIPGFQC